MENKWLSETELFDMADDLIFQVRLLERLEFLYREHAETNGMAMFDLIIARLKAIQNEFDREYATELREGGFLNGWTMKHLRETTGQPISTYLPKFFRRNGRTHITWAEIEEVKNEIIQFQAKKSLVEAKTLISKNHQLPLVSSSILPKFIHFREIPDTYKEFLAYEKRIEREVLDFQNANFHVKDETGELQLDPPDPNDPSRFEWYWNVFESMAIVRAIYSLHGLYDVTGGFKVVDEIRMMIAECRKFTDRVENLTMEQRYKVRENEFSKENAYMKIVRNNFREFEKAPIEKGEKREVTIQVFLKYFIVLPFLEWKLEQLTQGTTEQAPPAPTSTEPKEPNKNQKKVLDSLAKLLNNGQKLENSKELTAKETGYTTRQVHNLYKSVEAGTLKHEALAKNIDKKDSL